MTPILAIIRGTTCWISRATAPLPMESSTNSVLPRYSSIWFPCLVPAHSGTWAPLGESWVRTNRSACGCTLLGDNPAVSRAASALVRPWWAELVPSQKTRTLHENQRQIREAVGERWDGRPTCTLMWDPNVFFLFVFWYPIKHSIRKCHYWETWLVIFKPGVWKFQLEGYSFTLWKTWFMSQKE